MRIADRYPDAQISEMDSPPGWEHVGWLLDSWLRHLLTAPLRHDLVPADSGWESLTLLYFSEEQASRERVSEIVRSAARANRLPTGFSAMERYYLFVRLQCAEDFLGMLHPPRAQRSPVPELPREWPPEKTLEWLLIDLWERRFDHWLKIQAIALRGPFGFYGIGAADPASRE